MELKGEAQSALGEKTHTAMLIKGFPGRDRGPASVQYDCSCVCEGSQRVREADTDIEMLRKRDREGGSVVLVCASNCCRT